MDTGFFLLLQENGLPVESESEVDSVPSVYNLPGAIIYKFVIFLFVLNFSHFVIHKTGIRIDRLIDVFAGVQNALNSIQQSSIYKNISKNRKSVITGCSTLP